MNTEQIALVITGAVAVILWVAVVWYRLQKKKRQSLRQSFGSIPRAGYKDSEIPQYWKELKKKIPSEDVVDDVTWNDLDMELVYDRINCCQSSVGQDYLYAALHRLNQPNIAQTRQTLYEVFAKEPLRIRTQLILDKLGKKHSNGLWLLMFYPDSFVIKHSWVYSVLALMPLAAVGLMAVSLKLGLFAAFSLFAINSTVFYKVKETTKNQLECISYFYKCLGCANRLKKALGSDCEAVAKQLDELTKKFRSLNVSSFMLAATPSSDADMLLSMFGMITLLPVVQYCAAAKKLKKKSEDIALLFELIGEIDGAISVLSYRESLPFFCQPQLGERFCIEGKSVCHPLLCDPVENDVSVSRGLLLTGSNASGKSTYIRAIAINGILAQNIDTCFATQFYMRRGLVMSSMAVADNIVGGESYFVAEIKSMRRLIQTVDANKICYCLIDEILKGTNTVERVCASVSVLEYLQAPNCICIAATHDIELTKILKDHYVNNHFSEQVDKQGVHFDYKLKSGPSTTRNAIQLLSYYQFPDAVIDTAHQLVAKLEQKSE